MKLFITLALVTACASTTPPEPATSETISAPSCSSACVHLRSLSCSLGKPTARGASCETVCDNVRVSNAGVGFPVVCLALAKTCAIADDCR